MVHAVGFSCAMGPKTLQHTDAGFADFIEARRLKQKNDAALLKGLKGYSKQGIVYAIKMADIPGIKIGFATDLSKRMVSLRTSSPLPYRVVATFDGSVRHEKSLHSVFAPFRIQGEWFHEAQPVNEFVSLMSEDGFGDSLDMALIKADCHWRPEQSPVLAETIKAYLIGRGLSF